MVRQKRTISPVLSLWLCFGLWLGLASVWNLGCPGTQQTPDGGGDAGTDGGLETAKLGSFTIQNKSSSLSIARSDGTILLESLPAAASSALPSLGTREALVDLKTAFGMFVFREEVPPWDIPKTIQITEATDKEITLRAGALAGTIALLAPHVLQVTWKAQTPKNRMIVSFGCAKEDRFFGLGARVHGTEHRGESIPSWISEQGIGKIRRKTPEEGFPIQGDIHDTYLAVPFVMSQRGFGLLLDKSERSLFHLCPAETPERWAIEVWDHEIRYEIIDGPAPLTILERLTEKTGRPPLPPSWVLAPWMDAIHGQNEVETIAAKIRQEKIPSSVIWTEDWVGSFQDSRGYHLKYQWQADPSLYPDLKGLATSLHAKGFKFLGYFNPFLEEGSPQWTEAMQKGYAIKDEKGDVITFSGVFFKKTSLPDLTDPKVVSWLQGFLKTALDLGFDGWMADYAEWLPVESRLSDGSTGWKMHNLYPILWQKANREVFDQERKDGDFTFFVRSGWTKTGGLAPVVWAGDQQTEFGGYDGLQSVLPLCLSMGMSGLPITTHDIAGYSSIGVPPSTKELFYRWTQLGAFSAIMRLHHGAYADQNWRWDKDADTIAFFRRYTRLHVALYPYRLALFQEAATKGWPVMRHLYLHFPEDPKVASLKDQFLLGPFLLVAPVVEDKARKRKVYLPKLPKGRWFSFPEGKPYDSGQEIEVEAPEEEIPVFARAGTILERLGEPLDTLAPTTDPGLIGPERAKAGLLLIDLFAGDDQTWKGAEGATWSLVSQAEPKAPLTTSVDGQPLQAICKTPEERNCLEAQERRLIVRLPSKASFRLDVKGGDATFLSFEGKGLPVSREVTLILHW